jgi:hypothetical protein
MINQPELRKELKRILEGRVGREASVTAGELARMFGYEDDRIIRKAIEDLIDGGFPVCSATEEPAGYFFPKDEGEARVYSKSLQRRAVRIFLRRRRIISNTREYYENLRRRAEIPVHQERLL